MNTKNTSMLVFGTLILCAAVVVIRKNHLSTKSSPNAKASFVPPDWELHEFNSFRLRTPSHWKKLPSYQKDNIWMHAVHEPGQFALDPDAVGMPGSTPNSMLVTVEPKPSEHIKLKDIIAKRIQKFNINDRWFPQRLIGKPLGLTLLGGDCLKFNINDRWFPQRLIGKPLGLTLLGGDCLVYKVESQDVKNCDGLTPGSRRTCVGSSIRAYCYSKKGALFDFQIGLGNYYEMGKPDAKTIERGRIFEKVLRSIEFL